MNDKITFPRLAASLADKSGRSKRFSEDFLREFFSLISERLETGDSVKVKGLGTFRLSRVEPRRSVDVTTGQPMEISGHSKVVFLPSKELADAVNSPFEAFSAIEIDDTADLNLLFSNDEIDLDPQSPAAGMTLTELEDTEESEETRTASEEREEPSIQPEDRTETPEDRAETPAQTEELTSGDSDHSDGTIVAEHSEESIVPDDANENIAPDNEAEDMAVENQSEVVTTENSDEDVDYDDHISRKRNRRKRIMITFGAALIALIATLAVWYVFATEGFNRVFNFNGTVRDTSLQAKNDHHDNTATSGTAIILSEGAKDTTDDISTIAEESDVPTAPSDAIVYDTISTTRYLTTMARSHYGNFNLWPYIYEENKAILGHPDRIRPGTSVVIPKLSKYGVDPQNKDHIEKAKKMGIEIYARYGKKIN